MCSRVTATKAASCGLEKILGSTNPNGIAINLFPIFSFVSEDDITGLGGEVNILTQPPRLGDSPPLLSQGGDWGNGKSPPKLRRSTPRNEEGGG